MPFKVAGAPSAVGYWGRDPHCRLTQEETAQKERALLQDQLRTNGHPVTLWQPIQSSGDLITPGIVPCTCRKDTTQNSDTKCLSCYGMQFVPGFLKFMHETIFFSSAEAASFLIVGGNVDITKKPNRIQIAPGQTNATIITTDKAYVNPTNEDWEIELEVFRRSPGDTNPQLDFSTDGGVTYHNIPLITAPSPPEMATSGFRGTIGPSPSKPIGSGVIRFRIILFRASATSPEAPTFEILRARHPQPNNFNPILLQRKDMSVGQILILKTWDVELVSRLVVAGRTVDYQGDRSWTAPLDFYDLSLTMDTPPCALDDRGAGIHPFFEYASGVRLARRFAIEQVSLDATVNSTLVQQVFSERRIQAGEIYNFVF
jgi:hypothetical protein